MTLNSNIKSAAALRPLLLALSVAAASVTLTGCTNSGASEPASDPVSKPQTVRPPRGSF